MFHGFVSLSGIAFGQASASDDATHFSYDNKAALDAKQVSPTVQDGVSVQAITYTGSNGDTVRSIQRRGSQAHAAIACRVRGQEIDMRTSDRLLPAVNGSVDAEAGRALGRSVGARTKCTACHRETHSEGCGYTTHRLNPQISVSREYTGVGHFDFHRSPVMVG
jgi:hypothetical protein